MVSKKDTALNFKQAIGSSFAHKDLISSTAESNAVPFQNAGDAQAATARVRTAQTLNKAIALDDRKSAGDWCLAEHTLAIYATVVGSAVWMMSSVDAFLAAY